MQESGGGLAASLLAVLKNTPGALEEIAPCLQVLTDPLSAQPQVWILGVLQQTGWNLPGASQLIGGFCLWVEVGGQLDAAASTRARSPQLGCGSGASPASHGAGREPWELGTWPAGFGA